MFIASSITNNPLSFPTTVIKLISIRTRLVFIVLVAAVERVTALQAERTSTPSALTPPRLGLTFNKHASLIKSHGVKTRPSLLACDLELTSKHLRILIITDSDTVSYS